MTTKLYIEDLPADLNVSLSSLLTFSIDDVKDFASRQTAYSKTITIPGTANNNRIFGNIFETGISNAYDALSDNVGYNFNASKSARALLFQDNLQTFKGTLRLLQINKDRGNIEYEVALNGEITSLVVALSSGFLTDLDFSAYNIIYNATSIVNSWNNPGGSGVYFPLIDYGTYSTAKHDWHFKTFRPALYVKEYLDKIFARAGFRYDCALFNTPRFKNFIVPHNRKTLTRKDSKVMTASITSTKPNGSVIAWDAITSSVFALTSGNTHIEYTASPSISGTLNVSVSGNFKNTDLRIDFSKNGVVIITTTLLYTGTGAMQFFGYTGSWIGSFATGDYISCTIYRTGVTTGYDYAITTNTVNFVSDIAQDVPVEYLGNIAINDTIPQNIRQIDFFTSIIKLFNLYVYESRFDERLIHISPYIDFYSEDSIDSIDWTYKFNRDKAHKIKPMSELNSKTYNFRYKDDSDFYNDLYKKRYNQSYGSYIFDSLFEFSSAESSIDLIFAPTPLVGYSGEEKVYPTIFKKSGDVEENIDSVIRILQAKKITGVATWNIVDGATVLNSGTDYGYAGHFDDPDNPTNDLNFGVLRELFFTLVTGNLTITQFNVYWSRYMAEICDKDSKLLIGYFYLTPKDIFDLEFRVYIFLDSVLYRLNKITDYNATTPDDCEVQLLKVINTVY